MRFVDILGQERAKRFLKHVLARERVPHAYLFTGIPGVGKKSTAQALATALNCAAPENGDGCGACPSCRKILHGNDPDFLVIRPKENNIRIDQVRELNRGLTFTPLSSRYRVVVICQAETMTPEAANAFLKTLEEPPPGNVFVLTATEPLDLLPTVVSRCQRVSFQPLPLTAVASWIKEKEELSEKEADIIARISGGSLGRALEMAEEGFLEKREKWLSRIAALPTLSGEKAMAAAFKWVEEFRTSGVHGGQAQALGPARVLEMWKSWYRDLLVVRAGNKESLLMNRDFSQDLKKISNRINIKNLAESFHLIDRAKMDLLENRNVSLVFEHLLLQLNKLVGG